MYIRVSVIFLNYMCTKSTRKFDNGNHVRPALVLKIELYNIVNNTSVQDTFNSVNVYFFSYSNAHSYTACKYSIVIHGQYKDKKKYKFIIIFFSYFFPFPRFRF